MEGRVEGEWVFIEEPFVVARIVIVDEFLDYLDVFLRRNELEKLDGKFANDG